MCSFYDLLLKLKHKKMANVLIELKKKKKKENITGYKSNQHLVSFASFIFPIPPVSRSLMKTKTSPKLHHLANSVFYVSMFRKHCLFCQYSIHNSSLPLIPKYLYFHIAFYEEFDCSISD